MKIGILCTGDTEAEPFIDMTQECRITEKAMLRFYQGTISGVQTVTLFSGVCKVNAAIAAQILIDTFGCTAVINAGTAGGMTEELGIFDIVISAETAYHDVAEDILTDFHPWMDSIYFKADDRLLAAAKETAEELGQRYRAVFGRMLTGETFIEDDGREAIRRKYAPLCVDMETAAVAHVCYVNRIPFISVRSITDTPDRRGKAQFEQNCEKASRISAEFVRAMLGKIGPALDVV